MRESNDVQIMRAIIHNKILLNVIMSKLGMEDDEIDRINQRIYDSLDKLVEESQEELENGIDE